MAVRTAQAEWKGTLSEGQGTLQTESGAIVSAYDFASRFETGDLTNPEELIGAAHAACFAMAFSHILSEAGYTPNSVAVTASVHMEKTDAGPTITEINLDCEASVDDIDEDTFLEHAESARAGCPVSRALAAVDISLEARLL
jgi:osmotically inducible protein OsmC